MRPFDPLTMPLEGRRLVEAGAGTGKTWALTLLVARMVLERGLDIGEILVLTYTRAATAELKDRIAKRLRLARRQLAVREAALDYDAALQTVLERVTKQESAATAAFRLENALRRMDEADITTIHSFCRALIQEQALEAGLPLDLEVLPDEAALREEVAADFWRRRFYPLGPEEARLAAECWPDPTALLDDVSPTLALDDDAVLPPPEPDAADALEAARAELRENLADLRKMWATECEAIVENLADAACWKKGSHCHPDALSGLLAELDALLAAPEFSFPCLLPDSLSGFTADALIQCRKQTPKKCGNWQPHAFFIAFGRFWQLCTTLRDSWKIAILHEARAFIRDELARRKLERGCFGYDDMLTLVAGALADPETGPRLAGVIRRRRRAVFVDEFQDSDPAQYRIFAAIAEPPEFPLVMIGDPKQAIYAFRGGDIFTYLRARRDCPEDGRYTMTTNQRSTPAMVAAVNALFSLRPDPFAIAKDFGETIPFHPALPSGRVADAGCSIDGAPLSPLHVLLLTGKEESVINKGTATGRAADICAEAIRRLLALADAGRAEIDGRPLSGGDLAVLTADHRQADLIRQALARRGLASVCTGRRSVFATSEAAELESLLRALLNPQDRGLCAEALATTLCGVGLAELADLEADGGATPLLHELRAHWLREGVGPMLHRLFRTRQLVARLSALPDGERRLTNFLHLAELLDEEEDRLPGRERLLRRLERWRREAERGEGEAAEEQLLRLESDRRLIRIGTLHGAKGLEYPLVFLPFLWRARARGGRPGRTVLFHDRESLRPLADFAAADGHGEMAKAEERAEAVRLLYVALTRAKYANFVCWGRVRDMADTPLARLLHGEGAADAAKDEARLRDDLEALNKTTSLARILPPGKLPWPEAGSAGSASAAAPLSARTFTGLIPSGLGASSFTGIVSGQEPVGDMEEKGGEAEHPAAPATVQRDEDFQDIAAFPRGVNPGTCLHRMLELLDFARPVADQRPLVAAQLEQHGLNPAWTDALLRWLEGVLLTELPGSRALAGLSARDRVSELRFHFPFAELDFHRLDKLLAAFGLPPLNAGAGTPPKLAERLMTGSIDLVFRHGGRYYIADYKSNRLGADVAAYNEAALAEAMSRHHYHLQYLIYSTALRRHLRDRGLDPAHTFGGVYYLFARGMRPGSCTGIFRAEPAPALLEGMDELLGCGEAGHAG